MKKHFLCILMTLIVAAALAGCSHQAQPDIDSDADKVIISYGLWGTEERQAYTLEQISVFEEKYPNIIVNLDFASWDTLSSEIDNIMAEGRQSDVMQINYDWMSKYGADVFYDLKQLEDTIQLEAFSDHSIIFGKIDDKQVAVPISFNTSVPVYNRSMYDYYQVTVPESIDELFAAAAVMKKDGIYQLGMEDKQILLFISGCYTAEYGVGMVDEDGNFSLSSSGCAYIAEFYKKCLDENVIYPRTNYEDGLITGNRVAGVITWLSSIEKYKAIITNAGDTAEVGKFFWSDTERYMGNYVKPATMLAISAKTEHPKEAALLLDFLCNDEEAVTLQGIEKGVPDSRYAQRYLMKAGCLNNDTFYSTLRMNFYMEYMENLPPLLEESDFIEKILSCLDDYAYGRKSLEDTVAALRKMQ